MKQFCKAVLDFLQATYEDAYTYKIEQRIVAPDYILPNNIKLELTIKLSSMYRLIITNDNMQYLFHLYKQGDFIEEQSQYLWQKN
jgi:hypothetical protein